MTEPQRRSLLPVIIGIGVTSALLFFLAIIAKARRDVQATGAPALTIIGPASGEHADSPLVVLFQSDGALELGETGWGHRNLHIHAWINGVQHMPAATDIVAADSAYRWTLPAASRGDVLLHLGWADQAHRPLREGASDTVRVRLD